MKKVKVDLVVTRHKALQEVLIEKAEGFDLSTVILKEHVTEDDVRGKVVIGVLPMRLAALTRRFFELSLSIPAEMRGQELSKEQVKQYMKGIQEYVVATPEQLTVEVTGDDLSWVGAKLEKGGYLVRGITVIRRDMLGEYTDKV